MYVPLSISPIKDFKEMESLGEFHHQKNWRKTSNFFVGWIVFYALGISTSPW